MLRPQAAAKWSYRMKTNTSPMPVRHQNWMLALRQLAGVPAFRPVNETITFCCAGPLDLTRGMDLARISQEDERDIICAHWANAKARRPLGYTVVLRDVLSVEVMMDCTAFLWGEGRLMLVSPREKMTIQIGDRGVLQRNQGLPQHFLRGTKLASMRINEASKAIAMDLVADDHLIATGGEWTAPSAPVDAPVRFS